ncbi:MAG TPA: MaoC/PaaZ C-terminal domain-containing protein [Acidimicrobiia bacterium]|nr:MaoC/PaaZ C-terminal domain-containing protein [Acidimicrobiia bacterium]
MAVDPAKVVGAELAGDSFSWDEEDVILYNLGVGAGDPPDDPGELSYTYEADLRAVPTFGTIPPFAMMMSLGAVEGLELDLTKVLHGDQTLTVHAPIPTSGKVTQAGRVVDVYDKVKGSLIVLEIVSTLERTGEPLFTNRSGVYVRGAGGFGGDPGPTADGVAPEREPDIVVESKTLPQQALLYRMASGDKNPLHADPAFAAFAGFERPILHGLCTYGIVCKAVVDNALGGDPTRVGTYTARFTGHVFPGETLVTSIWAETDRHIVSASTKERGVTVLSNAAITPRSQALL